MAWPDEGINVYTWANKPLASAYTGRAFISDIGGGSIWISNGTRWYPENGRVVLFSYGTNVAATYAVEGVPAGLTYLAPIGLMQLNDKLRLTISANKSGTSENGTFKLYIGQNAAFASNTNVLNIPTTSFLAGATQISYGAEIELKKESTTQVRKIGGGTPSHPYSGGSSIAIGALSASITNMDTVPMYIIPTITSTAGVETYTVYDYRLELITDIA